MQHQIIRIVLLGTLGPAILGDAFRDCFFGDSREDSVAGRACDWEKPDVTKMSAVRMPDDEEECHLCAKFFLPAAGDATLRGCLTISSWRGTMRNLGFTEKDECMELDDGRIYCVCKESLCNGTQKNTVSMMSLLLLVLHFIM